MTYVCTVRLFRSSFLAANGKATLLALDCCLEKEKEKAVYYISDMEQEGTEKLKEGKPSHNTWNLVRVQG